jgi:peroxiredoxin
MLPGTALREGRVVPPVSFRSAGSTIALSRFRHRTALVLAFLHERCAECGAFAGHLRDVEDDFGWAGAIARAVVPEDEDLAIPVLVDPGGRATRTLLGADAVLPAVVILDRYGAATSAVPATGHRFPSTDDLVQTVTHLALQCPECGVSDWPDDE